MEALYEATKTMVASENVNTILNIIVKESTRIMKVKGAILRLVKKGEEELTPSASFGLSETFLNKGPVKRGEGLFPMNFDEVIMVEDVKTDPRIVYPKEAAEEGIRSIISIPLAHKGEVKGDLRFYSEFPRRFSNDEISFLKIMAGGAAVILDNASTWKELVDTNKRIILFANKMSHDLRAPVFAVQSLLSAMEEGYAGEVSPKQKEILTRCIKKQEQLLFLIRDILNLAEEQVSIQGQKLVPINLNEVATETLKILELLFQKKKIAIIYNSPSDPIPFQEIPGDFQRLLFNLLENALRYTPEGGKVELEVKNNAENISILVKDTGIGIAPEDIDKIFEEFHRTSQAKKFIQDGTGLGLPIVRSIVRRYNGHINVESQLETGTKIFITFPHT
jgi:signal transduction histidine kinase